MTNPNTRDVQGSKTRRIVTAVFGVFLMVLAIAILLSADEPMGVGAFVVSLVMALLGVDACVSAARNKPSLVERIGPLP